MNAPLAHDVKVAAEIVARIRDSGLAEDDPDFAAIVETEIEDTQARLVRMLRAARWAERQAKASKEIEAEIKERRARYEAKAEQIRSIVQWAMGEIGIAKIEAADLTASLSAGKPAVVVSDETALPDEFCRITRAPNKTALKEALLGGATIPGATLGNGQATLTVRTR
jgi:hypothetical protein